MQRKIFSISVIIIFTLGFAVAAFANVPPPPVNQNEGIDDGIFNNLVQADCRVCHEGNDPDIVIEKRCSGTNEICLTNADCTGGETCEDVTIKNRHHLLVLGVVGGELIPDGSLLFNGFCSVTATTICSFDLDCPVGETCENVPIPTPPAGPVDGDLNGDTIRDTNYACNNCHPNDRSTPANEFPITRDCLRCHVQVANQGSVHHIAATSPARENRCFVCHGDLVNLNNEYCSEGGGTQPGGKCRPGNNNDCPGATNVCGDGHIIPTYDPSLVTPRPSKGQGPAAPLSEIVFRGSCNYCHNTGNGICKTVNDMFYGSCSNDTQCTMNVGDICVPDDNTAGVDTASGALVFGNSRTHHNTGVANFATNVNCEWCHDALAPSDLLIRACENCHGFDSLHNIQTNSMAMGMVDTNGDGQLDTANIDEIIQGAEDMWYGHVGNPDDCLGCHGGHIPASAPGTGPMVPNISTNAVSVSAGTDRAVTLTGSSFENYSGGWHWTSVVKMTASDGSSTTLTPDAISQGSVTVTIPGTTAPGNYDLRVAKDDGYGTGGTVNSNPVVLSVVPDVAIANVNCSKKRGMVVVTGTGFGEKPDGTDADLSLQVDGQTAELISWTDTRIMGSVDKCSKRSSVTVNSVFGSDTSGRSCRGNKCR